METANVTIVVVPRDHFSDTQEALESVYANSNYPFDLVYVDGGSPNPVARYLRQQAEHRGFRLLRTEHYLSPNRARNLGARGVTTRHIIFIDNDVIVAKDWLAPLVECAETTGAAIVGPLTFERRPVHTSVHFTGGEARVEVAVVQGANERHLVDTISYKIPLQPTATEIAEFHCMLVRTEAFLRVGGLDEKMLSTRENLDFCMNVRNHGGAIYTEPRSRVTYLPPENLKVSDMAFFALRWSDDWDMSSFRYFRDKWNLTEDAYFLRQYRYLGWRRREMLMRNGLLRWLVSTRLKKAAEWALRPLERRLNKWMSNRYSNKHDLPLYRGQS
jgi:GT2 family glycosyltransferase